MKVVLQSLVFIVVGRTLGAATVGTYAAVMAIVGFFAPFAGLSAGHWLLKNVKQHNGDPAPLLTTSLIIVFITGTPATIAAAAVCWWILNSSIFAAACFAASELLCNSAVTAATLYALANSRHRTYAVVAIAPAATKLVAALFLAAMPEQSLELWSALYLAASCLAQFVGIAAIRPKFTRPARFSRRDACWCAQVSITQLAQGATNDLDKPFVAASGNLLAAGQYAGAYRLLSLAYFLAKAVQSALYPMFFAAGRFGYEGTRKLLRTGLRFAITYGSICAVMFFFLAPLAPLILGASFEATSSYLRWLCLVPLVKFVQWFLADALTALNKQLFRTVLQVLSAVLTAALLWVLVPRFSVFGAIGATYLAEAAYMGALAFFIQRTARKSLKMEAVNR